MASKNVHDEVKQYLDDIDDNINITTPASTGNEDDEFERLLQEFISNELTEDDQTTIANDKKEAEEKKRQEEEARKKAEEEQKRAEEEAKRQQALAEQQLQSQTQAVDNQSTLVWIPRTGSKYHTHASCSNMKNPSQVSKEQAIAWGFEPCKKCY